MDYNQIVLAIGVILASPLVKMVVNLLKEWLNPSPAVIPWLAVSIGLIAGGMAAVPVPNTDPIWLKWVVYLACGALSGAAARGLWESDKNAVYHVLDKEAEYFEPEKPEGTN